MKITNKQVIRYLTNNIYQFAVRNNLSSYFRYTYDSLTSIKLIRNNQIDAVTFTIYSYEFKRKKKE